MQFDVLKKKQKHLNYNIKYRQPVNEFSYRSRGRKFNI
jgi:hypothetical protein